MNLPSREQLKEIQDRSKLDPRTITAILRGERVGATARARFQQAADDLGVKLARDFFIAARAE